MLALTARTARTQTTTPSTRIAITARGAEDGEPAVQARGGVGRVGPHDVRRQLSLACSARGVAAADHRHEPIRPLPLVVNADANVRPCARAAWGWPKLPADVDANEAGVAGSRLGAGDH